MYRPRPNIVFVTDGHVRAGQVISLKKKYTRKQRDEISSDRTHDEVMGNAYVFFVFLAIKNLSQFPQLNFTSADADTTPLGVPWLGVVSYTPHKSCTNHSFPLF